MKAFTNFSNNTSLRNVWIISANETSNSYENIRIEEFRKFPSSNTPLPLQDSLPLIITGSGGSPCTDVRLSSVLLYSHLATVLVFRSCPHYTC